MSDDQTRTEDEQQDSDQPLPNPGDTRRGEDIARNEQEAGRIDTGDQGPTDRPTGTSTARDYTGVDPKDPIDGGSPAG